MNDEGEAEAGARRSAVAVALGSNVGDRASHLDYAVRRLSGLLDAVIVSPFIETEPVGVAPQAPFLNGALVGTCICAPRALLEALLRIEAERGRVRPHPGAPRTLDLDLILFDGVVMDEPGLTLPHPRFRDRRFVLEPLAAIAPDLVDPVSRKTVRQLLAALSA